MTRDVKESSIKSSMKQQKDIPMLNLKVVIRCLPPTLTEPGFLEIVKLPDNDFFCFVTAQSSLVQFACSRAYINFLNQSDVVAFRDKWDGFPFKDTNGKEYQAVVELAPYQKIPKKSNRKPDPRCGTIEDDDDYKKFLEVLSAEIEPLPSAEAYLEELEAKQRAAATARVTTPLIDFLKRKRIERIKARERAREERRQKDKEKKRQREEEKRRLDRERKRKKEERERREKEIKQKKDEVVKSDGEKKVRERDRGRDDDRRRGKELEKKDSQIKLLKKSDSKESKVGSDDKKEQGRISKYSEQSRGKPSESERKKPESVKSQENKDRDRDKDRDTTGRDRNTYSKPTTTEKRKPSGRDAREREGDRYRDRGGVRENDRYRDRGGGRDVGGRDRYSDRERDRRPPSKSSSQDGLPRAGKSYSRDKLDAKESSDERKGDRRDERPMGRGEGRGDRGTEDHRDRRGTEEAKKADEKLRDTKRDDRVKIRNKDRPDMVRYQPGQRSWSSRSTRKDDGSESPRLSPTSSEGDKPKEEPKKRDGPSPKTSPVAGDAKKVEEKRPTAAKKFESQVRNSSVRSQTGKEDTSRAKLDQRPGDRHKGVGRGYREERSNRNKQRQDDARRKADENRNTKRPERDAASTANENKD